MSLFQIPDKQVLASFIVCGWINFIGDSARGVILPILWSYVDSLDHKDLGHLVAIFAVGRLISHIPYGMLADRARHRITFILSGTLFSVGAAFWVLSEIQSSLIILYLSQFVMGVGTGSLGVTRSYFNELSEEGKERTNRIAHLLSVKYIGLAVTPFLGPLAVITGRWLTHDQGRYSFPGYLLLFFGIVWIMLLIYPFKNVEETETGKRILRNKHEGNVEEQNIHEKEHQTETSHLITQHQESKNYYSLSSKGSGKSPAEEISKPGNEDTSDLRLVYGILILINSLVKASNAFYEVNVARLLIQYYHFDQYQVGLLISSAGIVGAFELIRFESLFSNHWTPYQLLYSSLFTMVSAQLLVILTNVNVLYSPVHLSFQMDRAKHVELTVLVLNIFIVYSFAYPIAATAVTAKYSNLKEYGKQGTLQSLMSVSSSLSRILASIASFYLIHYRILFYAVYDGKYHIYNQSLTGGVLLLSSTGMLLLIVFRDKIIRYGKEGERMKSDANYEFNRNVNILVFVIVVTCIILSIITMFF